MTVGLVLVIVGLAGVGSAYGFKAMFVDRSDKENPSRKLNVGMNVAGAIAIAWGIVLLLFGE